MAVISSKNYLVDFYQGRHLKWEFYFFSGIMVILVIYLF